MSLTDDEGGRPMSNPQDHTAAQNTASAQDTRGTGSARPSAADPCPAGRGLCVGRDTGEAVSDDYPGAPPWRFTGGTIRQVQVNVSGKPYVDLEHEAVAMMSRE
jgi:hypothetical protein